MSKYTNTFRVLHTEDIDECSNQVNMERKATKKLREIKFFFADLHAISWQYAGNFKIFFEIFKMTISIIGDGRTGIVTIICSLNEFSSL